MKVLYELGTKHRQTGGKQLWQAYKKSEQN
jgi:hypothetical protein